MLYLYICIVFVLHFVFVYCVCILVFAHGKYTRSLTFQNTVNVLVLRISFLPQDESAAAAAACLMSGPAGKMIPRSAQSSWSSEGDATEGCVCVCVSVCVRVSVCVCVCVFVCVCVCVLPSRA